MEEEQGGEGGPVAPVSLPIHATIQQMQSRNGLRHSDYAQYRRYATRRLRRVRTSKDVNFLLSKGKTFLKGKRVSAEDITSGRHLLVPLLMAERAWAYAMQLKLDAEDGVPCSVRRHMCRRLAKATKFARELEQLCTSAADERTCLEATAYAEWMVGIYSLEREQWMEAMEHLSTASRVCTELGRVGSLADQDLFSVRAEEIEPSLRYCKYQLQRGGGAGLDPSDMLKLQQDACSPASDDLLAAKLAKVVSETRQVEAHALESVTWRGHRLLLRSEKLRMSLVVANDRVRMLEDAGTADPADPKSKSKVEGLYLRVFNAYDDSLSIIHKELALLESEGKGARAEAERKQFLQLSDFAKHAKLAIMLKRNLGLIAELKSEPQPEVADIVHVCDSLLQNVREMRACLERADTDVAEDDMDEEDALNELLRLEANESKFRTVRCYYLAEAYSKDEKWLEAATLYDHAAKICRDAHLLAQQLDAPQEELDELKAAIAGGTSRSVARAIVAKNMGSAAKDPVCSLEMRLNEFSCGSQEDGFRIADFPPAIKPVVCKPILLDTVHDYLEFPDLTHRTAEAASESSTIGSIFNWAFGRSSS